MTVMRKLLILVFSLILFISLIRVSNQQTTYTLISEIDTSKKYASNMLYKWSVRVSPVPPVTTIVFEFSWMQPLKNTTDPNTGRAVVYAKTPTTSVGKTHTITVKSEAGLFAPQTFTINTEVGVYPEIECYKNQFYNPEGSDDIVIYVMPVETDYQVSVVPTTWDIVAVRTSDKYTVRGGSPTEVSLGKYKVIFNLGDSSVVKGTYNVTVTLTLVKSGITFVAVPNSVIVNVGDPIIIAKAVCGDRESYIVVQPSGERNTASALFIPKGTQEILVEFYDTKLNPLVPQTYDFRIYTPTGTAEYPETLLVEQDSTVPNRFHIYFTFSEASYDLEVEAQRGVLYLPFHETIKINTEIAGVKIFEWILNPYFALGLVIFILAIALSVRKRVKKNEKE
jgi:hypothetical protein